MIFLQPTRCWRSNKRETHTPSYGCSPLRRHVSQPIAYSLMHPISMTPLIQKTLASALPLHLITPLHPYVVIRSQYKAVRSMSSESTQRLFQLRLDPLTGRSEWVVIEEQEVSESSPKSLLATTSYLDMLNDCRRNRAYREAIEKTVTKPCHVLDIGYY